VYSWVFQITVDDWLSGCCYPRRCILVHNKGPQFKITQSQEQVERRPWRDRKKNFKEGDGVKTDIAPHVWYLSKDRGQRWSEVKLHLSLWGDEAGETDPRGGRLVGRPWWLQRCPRAPPASCSESRNQRWRSPLLHRHLRRKQPLSVTPHSMLTQYIVWVLFHGVSVCVTCYKATG